MTRRSPLNRRDPSGTRRIERREIARQSRIIKAYAEAMSRVASGIEDDVNAPAITAEERDRKLKLLRDSMKEDLLASTDEWINDTSKAAAMVTDRVLKNLRTGITLGNVPVPREEVSMLRIGIEENVRTLADDMLKATARIVTEGYQEGIGAKETARRVRDAGITTTHNAERIVRTETIRVCDVVEKTRYTAAGCDGYMSYPTDDDRLCPKCRMHATGKAGASAGTPLKVYGLDEPFALPWHPNCRCTRLPHFADDTEVFTI